MPDKLKRTLVSSCLLTLTVACNASWPNLGGNANDNNSVEVSKFIPEDVTLDVSEMPGDDAASAKAGRGALPNPEAQRRGNALTTCGAVVFGFHHAAARALALGAAVRDDMSSPDDVLVAGTLHLGSHDVDYLADFSAFDFDGDSAPDGSGNAVDEPVALRMWVDRGGGYERFMCALVTTKPTDENLGAGKMFVKPAAPRDDEAADLQMHVEWDRTDNTHKWNEAWISGQLRNNYRFESSRHRVDHRVYEDGHLEKTVRSSCNFAENPYGFETFKSSAHFAESAHAALFSTESIGPNVTISFRNICMNFQTHETDDAACADFDTQDLDYLDSPTGDETAFPADFPEEPTFTADEADNASVNDNANDNANDNSDENEHENENENENENDNDNDNVT